MLTYFKIGYYMILYDANMFDTFILYDVNMTPARRWWGVGAWKLIRDPSPGAFAFIGPTGANLASK